MQLQTKIVAAAVLYKDVIFSMPKPARHHTIIHAMHFMGLPPGIQGNQGFLLDNGHYISRDLAAALALSNGQVEKLSAPPLLYSEDLW